MKKTDLKAHFGDRAKRQPRWRYVKSTVVSLDPPQLVIPAQHRCPMGRRACRDDTTAGRSLKCDHYRGVEGADEHGFPWIRCTVPR